jgi:hypothetical protein
VYFWRGAGHRKVRVVERIGTPEFDGRYEKLLKQGEAGAFKPPPRDAPIPRTLRWLGWPRASTASWIRGRST